jgi:hypothetical protein
MPTSTSSSNATASSDNASHTPSRGVQAGAIIGGLAGLVALIALILFAVRTWKVYRQKQRTEVLRSSWFYGGDVAEPEPEYEEPEQEVSGVWQAPLCVSRVIIVSHSLRASSEIEAASFDWDLVATLRLAGTLLTLLRAMHRRTSAC